MHLLGELEKRNGSKKVTVAIQVAETLMFPRSTTEAYLLKYFF